LAPKDFINQERCRNRSIYRLWIISNWLNYPCFSLLGSRIRPKPTACLLSTVCLSSCCLHCTAWIRSI